MDSSLPFGIPPNESCGAKPRSSDYFAVVDAGEIAVIITCGVVMVVTVLIYAEEMFHLQTRLHEWKPKREALVLLAVYPVTSVNSMFALVMPRVSGIADLFVALYFALCVFVFSQMLFQHFGGKDQMVDRLPGQRIQLQSPPCCCCFCCLPKPLLNMRRLKIIEFCVMQYIIYKPLAMYVMALVVIDAGAENLFDYMSDSLLYEVLSVINTCSTLLAVYGNSMLFKMSATALRGVNIGAKFYLIQAAVILENLQKLFLEILVSVGVITCTPPLDTTATSDRFHHQLLVFEMLLLAIAARVCYRHDVMHDDVITLQETTGDRDSRSLTQPGEEDIA